MATPDYFTVIESIVGTLEGREVEYLKGEVVHAGDPAVKRWPNHFAPLVVRPLAEKRGRVEKATAAPGEKRG